jgi:hypothetical protein
MIDQHWYILERREFLHGINRPFAQREINTGEKLTAAAQNQYNEVPHTEANYDDHVPERSNCEQDHEDHRSCRIGVVTVGIDFLHLGEVRSSLLGYSIEGIDYE